MACEPGEQPDGAASTVELLARLIDKSLLVAEQRPEGMRYRLLETMRAYARDQLFQSGESEAVGARHAAHFLRLAEQAEVQLVGDDQIAWLDRLAAEHANLRAAVDWATERSGGVAALRLVTALRYFWRVRGYYAEGIELLRGLLAHPTVAGGTTVRARALNAAGYLEFVRGQQARAGELLEEALSIGRSLGEGPVTAFALRYLCALANARRALRRGAGLRRGEPGDLPLAGRDHRHRRIVDVPGRHRPGAGRRRPRRGAVRGKRGDPALATQQHRAAIPAAPPGLPGAAARPA
ncbi:MAG: hypothetical protein IPO81_28155 [Kouleothrix sp.]|nr:hypothetical protein [Kouleothrix sp.]